MPTVNAIKRNINFRFGLPGFENLTKFQIVNLADYYPFSSLQSLEEPDVKMLILNIKSLDIAQQINIPRAELQKIELADAQKPDIFTILRINHQHRKLTANVTAPLIVNPKKEIGMQVILDNETLSMEYPVEKLLQ
jgi:flagellar assembly factor FliW